MRDAEKEARRWSLVKDFHGRHLKRDDNGGLVLYVDYASLRQQLSEEREKRERVEAELDRIQLGMGDDFGDDPVEVIRTLKQQLSDAQRENERMRAVVEAAKRAERVLVVCDCDDMDLKHVAIVDNSGEKAINELRAALAALRGLCFSSTQVRGAREGAGDRNQRGMGIR